MEMWESNNVTPWTIFLSKWMNEKMINNFLHVKNIIHLKCKLKIFSEKIVSKYADFWNISNNFGTFFSKRILLHLFFFFLSLHSEIFPWNNNTSQTAILINKQGVCYSVALPFTVKSMWRQKKNYGNSNISQCKKYNLQKIL
jgi:hypothetical protein